MHDVPSTIVRVRVRIRADKVKTCEKPVLAREIVL
jgi:hypothetical protein